MKKTLKMLKSIIILTLLLLTFIACDNDFNTIESNVIGEENTNFSTDFLVLPISAYNRKLEAVQIDNLPSNLLGSFNDPNFGKTTASIITQITPNNFNVDFGKDPVIDSVVIHIPYYSTMTTSGNSTTAPRYKLDSVYGNTESSIKLSIYQNNYFLRSFIPSGTVNSIQNYFSKTEELPNPNHNFALNGSQTINFDDHTGELIYENSNFFTSPETIRLENTDAENTPNTFLSPALRVSFKKENPEDATKLAFWKETIIDKSGDAVLRNANSFRKHFRGLYFKAEATQNNGNIALVNLNANDANITIYYTKGETSERIQSNYVLNFSGNKLNTFTNDFSTPLENGDKGNGDKTLYLKGLEGSMAVVDLFPTTEDLQNFKDQFIDSEGNQKKLINEAHLIIHEDTSKLVTTDIVDDNGDTYHQHDRIYAYDIKNNTATIDYQNDPTTNNTPLDSKTFNLVKRTGEGMFKIRLTEHLNNIVKNDSTNTKIGLVLSNNINVTSSATILNSNDDVTGIPAVSIISPRGTILYGSNRDVLDNKRLKLKIFFTETKKN